MNRYLPMLLLMAALGCGAPSEAPQAEEKAAAPEPPPDESRRFPMEGRVQIDLVNDHLLGKDYLPGGNLGQYDRDGKKFQLFLIVRNNPDAAAFLTSDIKDKLVDAKFVAHFGGYSGMDGDTPWFVFPKLSYVGGVVGLPAEEADIVAREFAGRIF